MKKGTILGKSQIILAVMVIALGAAVWFNVKYSSDSKGGNKYLGQAEYVDNTSGDVLPTGTESDYLSPLKKSVTRHAMTPRPTFKKPLKMRVKIPMLPHRR